MNIFFKTIASLSLCFVMSYHVSLAQVDVVGDFLRVGQQDAQTLTRAYLSPLASGVGAGFSSGWINRAKSHKPLGFSIQIRSGLALVPDDDKDFNLTDLPLSDQVAISNPGELDNSNSAPTISGLDRQGPELTFTDENTGLEVGRLQLPKGAQLDKIPTPYIQASLGLIKGIEITGRLIPEVSIVDDFGEFNMWGFGGKANINQWLPFGNRLPVDVAIAGGFNRTNISANLEVLPENGNAASPDTFQDQVADLTFDNFVGSAIIGKTLPFMSLFTGVGFQNSEMDARLKGTFPVPTLTGTETVVDPISFSKDGENSVHGIVGIQFKIALVTLSAEFTMAQYQTLNAGLGISFR